MPGLPQWNQNVSVQANPYARLRAITATYTPTIPASGVGRITINSPAGYISQILSMQIDWGIASGSPTGQRQIDIGYSNDSSHIIMTAIYDVMGGAGYNASMWTNTPTFAYPSDKQLQGLRPLQITFDETIGLRVSFWNLTNLDDAKTKKVNLYVVDTKIQG